MIVRRILTVALLLVMLLILELNGNTLWGWGLTLLLAAGFLFLWERWLIDRSPLWKTGGWLLFLAGFVAVLLLTWPPVKRVPAVAGDPVRTGVVALKDGRVRGVLNESGQVEIYAGIPYAAPPVGDLRWREPRDPDPWEGVLEADTFAPMSMQPRNLPIYYSLAQIIGYHDYRWFDFSDNYRPAVSEDSLYVNLWKPAGEQKDLPVLVYVHGGSLQTGQPWYGDYSGEQLAREGVIVVNMGYRLGVFGYLALPELAAESPNGTTGNYGLLDQIKALQWVRDNIAAFGGDPDNVTLAGESAGAASVSALCTSPLAKGLFRRAVLESSTLASKEPPHSFRGLEEALASGKKLMADRGVSTPEELRALPAEDLVGEAETQHHITVEGYALTETPYASYKKGIHNEEALLHGFNSRESGPFLIFGSASLKNYGEKVRAYFGDLGEEVLALYPAATDGEAAAMWAEIYGAVFFDYPHYCLSRLALEEGIPAYSYYFSKQNGRLGSWHSGEEVYAYKTIPPDSSLYTKEDRALMDTFSGYFLNFIKTGDPNGSGLPRWEPAADPLIYQELGDRVGELRETHRKEGLFALLDRMQGME